MHRYFPHTPAEIKEMLARCGMTELQQLYNDVSPELTLNTSYNLPQGMSETDVRRFFNSLGQKNRCINTCFAGGGFYDHYVPAVAKSLIERSEFLTAYTPYQPEISQGTLQYIFEYQTMMSRLTGLDISNASMYDGSTATAEAMMMAVAAGRKRRRILVAATINPAVREVVDTYARYHNVTVEIIRESGGITDKGHLLELLDKFADVAGVILPLPNYYGIIEDYSELADVIHAHKALMIMNCIAADLATLRSPGEWGADIACGDAQSLGIPLSFGGPYLGFLCATKSLMRKMPGRIVGATTDDKGRRCFVLTLQAREQHIRRDKATSNICSNQGLMTLYVSIYMSLLGTIGLCEVNSRGRRTANYLLQRITAAGGCRLKYPQEPFLNEFLLETDCDIDLFVNRSIEVGILPGIKVGPNLILMAATEMQTRQDVDRLVEIYKSL